MILFEKSEQKKYPIFNHEATFNEELLLQKDFFAIYKEKQLLYFQELSEELDIEEIKKYTKLAFGINELKIVEKLNQKNKTQYRFFKAVKTKAFKYFITYLILLIFLITFIFLTKEKSIENNEIAVLQNNYQSIKRNLHFNALTPNIYEFFKSAKEKEIVISKLSFKNSTLIIVIESNKKKDIYEFLNLYDSSIEQISFDEITKRFKTNATIKSFGI